MNLQQHKENLTKYINIFQRHEKKDNIDYFYEIAIKQIIQNNESLLNDIMYKIDNWKTLNNGDKVYPITDIIEALQELLDEV